MEKRTIETIFSLKSGLQIDTGDWLRDARRQEDKVFQLRAQIQGQIRSKQIEYVCLYCKQPVVLRGGLSSGYSSKQLHFSHLSKSDDCPIKDKHRFTEEEIRRIKYNGAKESELHYTLKTKLAYYLAQNKDVLKVRVEEVYKNLAISKEWRKPDVLTEWGNKQIAFELQLSTTFLSVIVGRNMKRGCAHILPMD